MSPAIALLSLAVPLVLAVMVIWSTAVLIGSWLHPLRMLTLTLGTGFWLLLLSLMLPLTGILGLLWWALLVFALVGTLAAWVRAARMDPPRLPRQVDPDRRPTFLEKRRVRLATRPSMFELVSEIVLFLALVGAMLWAG